ncbi:MAG: hypothetical protein Q8K11_17270 [Phenylobacterium sp.]|uniref:hypothetical protein n=1 Tax=Phenylobacterium sp. TaxID=1871053 RepID=UPI002730DC2A|nr:hypothetical protein [Phenylobacterium sp.]MDP2011924.1 hypothetical protein [Phenylobacterium sp.]
MSRSRVLQKRTLEEPVNRKPQGLGGVALSSSAKRAISGENRVSGAVAAAVSYSKASAMSARRVNDLDIGDLPDVGRDY